MTAFSPQSTSECLRRVLQRVADAPEQLRATLDAHSDPLIAFTAERTILAANASAESFFGYGPHELDARSTDALVPERLRQPHAPPMIATSDLATVELPGLRKDGAEMPVVWTFGSATGPQGPTFVMLVRDEASILAARERPFRSVYENALEGIMLVDDELRILDANPAACRLLRRSCDELVGARTIQFIPPTEQDLTPARVEELRAAGTTTGEAQIALPDGTCRRVEFSAVANVSPGVHLTVFRDIEDRKRVADRTEARLHASEERFHLLVDAISDYAIFMLDPTGHVATWNPGVARIKGYLPEEIVGRHFSVFYTPEDRAAGKPERILEAVRREGRFEDEGWRVRKDGSRFWANVIITALRDGSGAIRGFAKVTRDLTERRSAEEKERALLREQAARAALEKASRELERLNRAKDEFLATMSHELRTPLNAIQGWVTILRKTARADEQLERGLEVIERNAKAQARLVSDLLDVSRIITGKLALNLTRTELLPVILAAVEVVRPAAEAKGVRLVIDVDPDVGATMADADRMQQIVWNLLTNAVRFTPGGGRVSVTASRIGSSVVIRVEDTGAGIASEKLAQIFDRFMQVDSSTTRTHGGLGLGLAIVRHLVEAHGGTVEAHSEGLGRGATFSVTLPISAVDVRPLEASAPGEADGQAEPTSPATTRDALANVRVLVVDDDPDALELVRLVLEGAGATVTSASNAGDALARLDERGRFHVIVSDIGMPGMDGYALMRSIRSRESGADVPAIALTAFARREDVAVALRAGYQEHLAKPVDVRRLVQSVKTWSGAAGARR